MQKKIFLAGTGILSLLTLTACEDPARQYRSDSFKPSAATNMGAEMNAKQGWTGPVNIIAVTQTQIQVREGTWGKGVAITYLPLDGSTTKPQYSIQAGKVSEYQKGAAQLISVGGNSTRIQPNYVH